MKMIERAFQAAFADGFVCNEADLAAAVVAAFDPNDTELVEVLADAIALPVWEVSPETFRTLSIHQREHCYEIARAVISAIRAISLPRTVGDDA